MSINNTCINFHSTINVELAFCTKQAIYTLKYTCDDTDTHSSKKRVHNLRQCSILSTTSVAKKISPEVTICFLKSC